MKIAKNIARLFLLIVTMAIVSGCVIQTSIEDVKNSDNIGEVIAVSGTVQNTIKIGELSGYIIEDETGSISVSSDSLPEEGANIRVTGTLNRDTLLGYYIKAD